MELVGKQDVKFTGNDGNMIEGIKLHILDKSEFVMGRMCVTEFLRVIHPCFVKAQGLPLGEINIMYGRKGVIVGIEAVEPKK